MRMRQIVVISLRATETNLRVKLSAESCDLILNVRTWKTVYHNAVINIVRIQMASGTT
jgi:hypothetical protein